MAVQILRERSRGAVQKVVLGATREEGGTRSHTVTVGGDTALPFHHFEGEVSRPMLAMEVQDVVPDWPQALKNCFAGVLNDPGKWAKKCVDEYGADLIYLKLEGASPEGANKSIEQCVAVVKEVLEAVGVPLIVVGCEDLSKDQELLAAVAEAARGENLLLGNAEQDNYKSLVTACLAHNHSLIARSPLDINICKQLNILINEMNLSLNRIVIDPSIGGLGYGIEYAYSLMERVRLGALQGDKMLSLPVICTIGDEAWRAKEAYAAAIDYPCWGDELERGILWEALTAMTMLQAGAHILLMRHPQAVAKVREAIDQLMNDNSY
ncbi:MAG: acetyl-CoA decarbonylase/synthase complex subunit delta [Clostridia bacterium]|nr:acetyl-CoA decarbonylase/synthase complex subunit delta [Clostridia bacterium]